MLIILNPNAGDKSGPALLKDVVLPLLQRQLPSLSFQVKETTAPGDAGLLALDYLEKYNSGELHEDPVIVVSGGDTTIHEMIEKIANMPAKRRAKLVLIPSGTANALYHSMFPPKSREAFIHGLPNHLLQEAEQATEEARSKLYSILCFLSNGPVKPLQGTRTLILDKDGQLTNQNLSCVVVSSALHASILDIAESLRAEYPGIERFKVAAGQSITQWSYANLTIPSSYQIYHPTSEAFQDVPLSGNSADFEGPFAYLLQTTNVDRLEMEFRIAPLATAIPITSDSAEDTWMELLMIRPLRDKSLSSLSPDSDDQPNRQAFATRTMNALQAAYQDGRHVKLAYGDAGEVVDGVKEGATSVVEYLRVKEWEWKPDSKSHPAHLLCVDGEVLHIPEGGRVLSKLLVGEDQVPLSVYCCLID
ncbi:hypothetical protein CPB86DRAFT_732030 [Serendipita vermifera]|nr:hypothetical protein CPB86DRAFT_732030 [Serendipita vermifera]